MRTFILYTLAALGYTPVLAQTHATLDSIRSEMEQGLNTVVVTATRTPKSLKDVPVQTRILSRQDIQQADATNIQDLLQTEMPGIEFSYAMNQQINMNLAGFAGQSVLILMDGERLAGETMDNVDFTRLNMADVERIEIVRGSASALYGSNAAGGVINIITRQSHTPWSFHLDGRWGEHAQQRYNAVWGIHHGILSNRMTLTRTAADNYQVSNRGSNPQTSTFAQVYGDKTWNVNDRVALQIRPDLKLSGRLGYFLRTVGRVPDSEERYRDYQAGLKAEWQLSPRNYLEASYTFDQYDKSDFIRRTERDVRRYSNVQNSTRLLYNHTLRQTDILTLGADYMYDYLMNTNLRGDSHHQQSFDVFAQYDWRVNRTWELLGALRYDHFSDGNLSRLTPKLSARWNLSHELTLRASYGIGFRAPTLKEKYYNFDMAGIWIVEGTPDLRSEVSHNFSLSGEYTRGRYDFTLAGNYNRVNNRITTGLPFHKADDANQWYLSYLNLDQMNVYSVDASARVRLGGGFAVKAAYMFAHEDLDGAAANQYMPARHHSLTLRGDYDRRFTRTFALGVSLSGRALSSIENDEYYDVSDPQRGTHTVKYPAYSLWKLQLTGRFGRAVVASFTIDNLFNYRPAYYYYNAPLTQGINLLGGISIDIDKLF